MMKQMFSIISFVIFSLQHPQQFEIKMQDENSSQNTSREEAPKETSSGSKMGMAVSPNQRSTRELLSEQGGAHSEQANSPRSQ